MKPPYHCIWIYWESMHTTKTDKVLIEDTYHNAAGVNDEVVVEKDIRGNIKVTFVDSVIFESGDEMYIVIQDLEDD